MYFVLIAVAVLNCVASEEPPNIESRHHNINAMSKRSTRNVTLMNKEENIIRYQIPNKYLGENKMKNKPKKSPKSTIQKIIKKNKSKLRKVYFNQAMKVSTQAPKVDYDRMYGQDEVKKWDPETTTKVQKKLKDNRNRNSKVVRNKVPFHKLQKKRDDKRHKRGLSRELFILKDLDQIEFLSKEKDNDVVNAHIVDYLKV